MDRRPAGRHLCRPRATHGPVDPLRQGPGQARPRRLQDRGIRQPEGRDRERQCPLPRQCADQGAPRDRLSRRQDRLRGLADRSVDAVPAVIASLRAALIIGAGLWLCACRAASIDAQVTDSNGAPLRDAAVYLLPKSAPGRVAAAPQAVIEQKDREFIPFVTVIRTGTAVVFPNRDQTMHHVYSFSPPKNFQIKLYEGDPPDPVVFDTPHFAVTDAQGHALIEGLERGEYTAHVWHPHARAEWSSTVVLERGERERVSASLPTRTPPRKSKPPLDPTKY